MHGEEWIGWGSAILLLPTFGIQTYRQWQSRHEPTTIPSFSFFVLAFLGTGGQAVYSYLIGNRVYLALNAVLVVTNAVGLGIAMHRLWITRSGRTASHAGPAARSQA